MKSQSYMNRALRARDPRFAAILGKLGYDRTDMRTGAEPTAIVSQSKKSSTRSSSNDSEKNQLTELRKQYQQKFGKRPAKVWDVDVLAEKLAAEE